MEDERGISNIEGTIPMIRPQMIGHVHLKVRDLKRWERFYTEVLGFAISERVGGFLSLTCSSRHHDVALQEIGHDAEAPLVMPSDSTISL